MARKVFCRKYQENLEGMSAPPYPGEKGADLFENVSEKAHGVARTSKNADQ